MKNNSSVLEFCSDYDEINLSVSTNIATFVAFNIDAEYGVPKEISGDAVHARAGICMYKNKDFEKQ